MLYTVKTPWWLRATYPSATWKIASQEKILYLSFDDGPHPEITPYVLKVLDQFNARASFFSIGKNVALHPGIFRQVIDAGHAVGNHTYDHLNGWKSEDHDYCSNIEKARMLVASDLFRPPYGRIRRSQVRWLRQQQPPMRLIMWDVLSGDFDLSISAEKCASNVKRTAGPGSIIVFHDSEKAFPRLEKALPDIVKYFHEQGYRFESIH